MQQEDWITNEISHGLAKLLALRLDRHPPEDSVQATLAVWVETVCAGRVWSFERDAARFRKAFLALQRSRTAWPSPRDFLEALPSQPERFERSRALASDASIKAGQAALAAIGAMFRSQRDSSEPGAIQTADAAKTA